MRDLSKYRGVIPAFYACYDEAGNVSAERVRRLAGYLVKKQVKGLYVGGSSGECIYQSVEERKRTLEAVMDEAGGKLTIIAHVGCNNTAESMELAAHAQKLGVDAIASIPPIYFHLPDYAIADYWNEISGAAPDTDFIIYNIPQLAGVALTAPLYEKMLENKNVIGVKNSSMPVQDIQIFKSVCREDTVVFNGPDEQFVGGRIMGADAGIGGTYAVMPELFLAADDCIRNGKIEEATKIQNSINEIIYAMCSCKGNLYAVMKEILRIRGVDAGDVRKPLPSLFAEDNVCVETCAAMIERAVSALTYTVGD